MIAKFVVTENLPGSPFMENGEQIQSITMKAVTHSPFDKDGNSEDNSFARWTPSGELKMVVNNPNIPLLQVGKKFYLEFKEATN